MTFPSLPPRYHHVHHNPQAPILEVDKLTVRYDGHSALENITFHLHAGERVAVLKVTIPGLTVGRVPLVVSSVPPPPPIEDAPWWDRAAGAVFDALTSAFHALAG